MSFLPFVTNKKVYEGLNKEIEWTQPTITSTTTTISFLSSHVSVSKFGEYGGTQDEFELVRYNNMRSVKGLSGIHSFFVRVGWSQMKHLAMLYYTLYALPIA